MNVERGSIPKFEGEPIRLRLKLYDALLDQIPHINRLDISLIACLVGMGSAKSVHMLELTFDCDLPFVYEPNLN